MRPLVIRNGFLLTDPINYAYQYGSLRLEGGRISQVGEVISEDAESIDARGCWVVPGLIDAHTHLYGALASGMPTKGPAPRSFVEVLERVWWRLDKALTGEDIEISAYVGGLASLRSGITTIFDHHSSPACPTGSLDIIAGVMQKVGLRASLAYEVSDRDGPESREAGIDENRRFFQNCSSLMNSMLKAHFGLHAVFSVSDATLRRCSEIGNSLGAGFHLHVLEHRPELEKFACEHDGRSVVPFLVEAGILGPKTIAAHTVHIDSNDIDLIAKTGTHTVHNPKSNMGNGVGVSPMGDLLKAGVKACLGSDGFYDIPGEMAVAPLLQNLHHRDPGGFGSSQVIKMVYENNACLAEQTFGLPFGKLASGYAADILVIPYDPATPVCSDNINSHLVDALVKGPRTVIVDGTVRMNNGEFPGKATDEVTSRSRQAAAQLWDRF